MVKLGATTTKNFLIYEISNKYRCLEKFWKWLDVVKTISIPSTKTRVKDYDKIYNSLILLVVWIKMIENKLKFIRQINNFH